MKKILAVALLLSLMITLLGLSNVQAATITTSSHMTTPKVVTPKALTVYCWLPHDVEITNPDATWCISGSGQVNIYNVSKIVNVDSHSIAITTDRVSFEMSSHSTRITSSMHIMGVLV